MSSVKGFIDENGILQKYDINSLDAPFTASVGQILEVEETDDNGKPTKWKATDLPEISGEDGFSPIATVEQTDEGVNISIEDKNGTTTASVYHGKDGKTPYVDEEGYISYGNGSSNDGSDLDVQINGESIVENGVANIPVAGYNLGLVKNFHNEYSSGLAFKNDGSIKLAESTEGLQKRMNIYAVTSKNYDLAVKLAMCDGVGAEWTEEEKASARERIGISDSKTLLGEVVVTGHRKIQPLAIDYTTGIVTVDDCSFLPSDKIAYTNFRLCVRKKSDAFYPNNVIPQELYGGVGIQKISDNTLYLYQGSAKIESFTESATIDLNAWYLEYSEVSTSHITVDLTGMEFGNHLQVELFNPNAEVQSTVVMTTVVRDNENNKYLEYNQTDGIRPVNGDAYAFDSVRSIPSGNTNKVKGNAMPIRYIYDFIVDGDFIYVTGKNIFSVADNKDKLPVYYTEEKSILLQNKGLTKFGMSLGSQHLMIPEGSYVKVWEVHD